MNERRVKEVMHRELLTCMRKTPIDEVARRMMDNSVHALIVVDDDGYAIGIVSQTDLLLAHRRLVEESATPLTAGDIMTPTLITCTPDTTIFEVVTAMTRNHIHRLVVVKPRDPRRYPLGLISMTDIIRHLITDTPFRSIPAISDPSTSDASAQGGYGRDAPVHDDAGAATTRPGKRQSQEVKTMDVILLGPPGAGKGTQALTIEQQTGLIHVASGDLFRAALRQGTELGMLAKSYMDRGELVPDEVVIRMILERISQRDCAAGVLFDGFPRTKDQACALDQALVARGRQIDCVLFLSVPNDVLLRRIAGRQTCRVCGAIHNAYYFPSKRLGLCDTCVGRLYQRSDDSLETAQHRLEVYYAQTMPLIEHYRAQGKLVEIDGRREMALVAETMINALTSAMNPVGVG